MKLKHVIVTGFKSVKGTEDLLIDDNVTILIGANDHGKSNLLEAILRLNPEKPITPEDRNWDLNKKKLSRIEWHFSVEQKELDKFIETPIEGKGKNARHSNGGQVEEIDDEQGQSDYFPQNDQGLLIYFKDETQSNLQVLSVPAKISITQEHDLLKIVPSVQSFFTPINTNINDAVTLDQIDSPDYEFMRGLFQLSGLWNHKDVIFTQDDHTSKLINQASIKLTKELNKNWNQGRDLKWKLEHSGINGNEIVIRIEDPSVRNKYIRPSSRSSGFQTFFVLSMMIRARTYERRGNSYIFLFDEPGIYLHPQAQLDLQRSFESISNSTQIIYTTHSLFLVNKNHPNRNRVISKNKQGTKIDQKPFQQNWKAVRDSLGILFSNNFLIADKTLLVEGPSDVIYIYNAINFLKSRGEVDIDLNDFSVVDAGSFENYVATAKVMLSEGRNLVALMDGDKAGKVLIRKLEKICDVQIKSKQLVNLILPDDQSTEDIFADYTLIQESVQKFAGDQVAVGFREFVENFNLDESIRKIKPDNSKSLGLTIKEETSTWFKEKEELSKLSIALIYEDLTKNNDPKLTDLAKQFIQAIQNNMSLKGEKAASSGVFKELT